MEAATKFDHLVDYYPGPVARAAHRSRAQVKLAWGPLGTAKTTWLCWRIWYLARRAAAAGYSLRALLVRDTYRNLADSTLKTFLEWFPDGVLGYKAQTEPVTFMLCVGNRYHEVLFRHGQTEQDASMFLSTEYDFIGLEEIAPAYVPGQEKVSPGIAEGVFDMAYSRLTRKADRAAAIGPELAMTCNSPPLTHWASRRIIDLPPEKLQQLNWAHWMFPITDNAKNLRPDYYEKLELAWDGKRGLIRRFIKGERLPVFIGLPRFNLDQLDVLRDKAVPPPFRGFLTETSENILLVKPEANPDGYVRMWAPPIPGRQYVIGADVAEGIEGGDYSAAYVIDREDCSIAAAWHGHIEPQLFGGEELPKIGTLYNEATIGIESNNHGLAAINALQRSGYRRIYSHKTIDIRTRGMERVGIRTDQRTKPLMIDQIGAYLLAVGTEGVINDGDLISEMQTFGVDEMGRTGAQENCHDDRVIAFAVALVVNQRDGLERIFTSLIPRG